jgi:hypothetical protein
MMRVANGIDSQVVCENDEKVHYDRWKKNKKLQCTPIHCMSSLEDSQMRIKSMNIASVRACVCVARK